VWTRGALPSTLRTALIVAGSILYVVLVMPIKALLNLVEAGPDGVLLIAPGAGKVVVEPRVRGEVLGLVYSWSAGAGLLLTPQGKLVRKLRSVDFKGYVLSLAASLKTYLESRGYSVKVVLREVFQEELVAVVEVKKKSMATRILELLRNA